MMPLHYMRHVAWPGYRAQGATETQQCHAQRRAEPETALSEQAAAKKAKEQAAQKTRGEKSVHPESNQGPSDCCSILQSDALPTEL